jgi:uncharacterized protein YjbI with pentapeptide repeats
MANTPRFTNSKGRADLAILAEQRKTDTTAILEIVHADFKGVDLSGLDISDCYFSRCRFQQVNLKGSNIERTTFDNCVFIETDLSNTEAEGSDWRSCHVIDCKMVKFKGPRLTGTHCFFHNVDASYAEFQAADFHNTTFLNTDLSFAVCTAGVSLCEATFIECNLHRAWFVSANLSSAYIAGCNLEYANFKHATLSPEFVTAIQTPGFLPIYGVDHLDGLSPLDER